MYLYLWVGGFGTHCDFKRRFVSHSVGWGNPGSTRDLQQLIFLSFVACRTR